MPRSRIAPHDSEMIAPIRAMRSCPGRLVVGQGILRAVLRRVGHGDRRAVEEADAAALPEPATVDPRVEVPPDEAGHGGEEPLGQRFRAWQ
jgi:hypothetical protein